MIDADEYEGWRAHPVTRWFFAAMQAYAADMKDDVIAQVWANGTADLVEIAKRRGQAFSAKYFSEADHATIAKYHEETEEK